MCYMNAYTMTLLQTHKFLRDTNSQNLFMKFIIILELTIYFSKLFFNGQFFEGWQSQLHKKTSKIIV